MIILNYYCHCDFYKKKYIIAIIIIITKFENGR